MFIAIAASKDRLDVHVRPSGEFFAAARDGEGLERLADRLRGRSRSASGRGPAGSGPPAEGSGSPGGGPNRSAAPPLEVVVVVVGRRVAATGRGLYLPVARRALPGEAGGGREPERGWGGRARD